MRIESFRRKSLADVLESTQKAVRKDSVVPLTMCGDGSSLSVPREGILSKITYWDTMGLSTIYAFNSLNTWPES